MNSLTWVQPPDLLAHELVTSADEGKDVSDVRARWLAAGGQAEAPHSGLGQDGDDGLRALALELLDELDARPVPESLEHDEPMDLGVITEDWSAELPRFAIGRNRDAVHGAWLGRAAGCLLGKPVEKIPREGIREILQSQDRWPLDDWFTARGLPDDIAARWPWNRRSASTSLAEHIDGMPEDDDLNFCLIALLTLEHSGPFFTSHDVAGQWLANLPGGRVFTAERVAYRNLLLGIDPPLTARIRNPYRDWIGAQIRSDVYGWANAGPLAAARAAYRDAVVSHTRNGVYGAMAVAAMCSRAVGVSRSGPESTDAGIDRLQAVLDAGLSVVPPRSRYAAAFRRGIEIAHSEVGDQAGLDELHREFGHLHWVHVLNNAALMTFAIARSDGDLGRGICLAVMGGWDTDSVGATVGSVLGAMTGRDQLEDKWVKPLRNRLATSVPGFDGIGFAELTQRVVRQARC